MGARAYLRGITVEPTIFFNTLGISFCFLSVQNLIVQKTCSPLVEPGIGFICNETLHVAEATEITFARSTLRSIISALSVPLLGSWRDVTGSNRIIIFVALTVEIIISFSYLLSVWQWSMSPWITGMFDAIIGGLFGESILHLTATCVITENSTTEDRTVRLQLFAIAVMIGGALGVAVNGIILTSIGYIWFFTVVIGLHTFSLVFAIIFVKDAKRDVKTQQKWAITEKLKLVFKSRPNNSVIWIMLICVSLVGTFHSAENNLLVYYLQQGFQLTLTEISIYGAYRVSLGALGSMIMSPIFIKVFKWSDFKIAISCSLLTIISAVSMTLAKTRVELYLFALLDVLKFTLMSLPKSVISKCVETDELGSFLGFGSILGIALPFAINLFYNEIFSATSGTIPGAFFIISAAGYAIVLFCFSISSCLYQQSKGSENYENRSMDIGKWKNFDPEVVSKEK